MKKAINNNMDLTETSFERTIVKEQSEELMIKQLFMEELKEIYWGEKYLLKILPKMQKGASILELKDMIEDHTFSAEDHVDRIEQVFEILGEDTQVKRNSVMEDIAKKAESILESTPEDSLVRNAGIIMVAQKIKYHEIASYSMLTKLAHTLGKSKIAGILGRTLHEEKVANEALIVIGEEYINESALLETESEFEKGE